MYTKSSIMLGLGETHDEVGCVYVCTELEFFVCMYVSEHTPRLMMRWVVGMCVRIRSVCVHVSVELELFVCMYVSCLCVCM